MSYLDALGDLQRALNEAEARRKEIEDQARQQDETTDED